VENGGSAATTMRALRPSRNSRTRPTRRPSSGSSWRRSH